VLRRDVSTRESKDTAKEGNMKITGNHEKDDDFPRPFNLGGGDEAEFPVEGNLTR
jgi:hypothetical protein